MKRKIFERARRRIESLAGVRIQVFAIVLIVGITATVAAPNQATGDIAGDTDALLDSNVVTLNNSGTQLALVKRAYLPDGTRVPTTSTLPEGSVVNFLIYISNGTSVPINDVSLKDVLDPAFVYQAGSIRADNSVANCAAQTCTPAEEDNIFAVVEVTGSLNDAVDGDVASYTAGSKTIDVGDESVANAQLNLAGQKVWAMVFEVTVP